jgi:hypothetical protein
MNLAYYPQLKPSGFTGNWLVEGLIEFQSQGAEFAPCFASWVGV